MGNEVKKYNLDWLKPCPFCGGTARIKRFKKRTVKSPVSGIDIEIPAGWAIGCSTSDCILYFDDIVGNCPRLMFYAKYGNEAVKAWNRRPELIISIPKMASVRTEMVNQIESARKGLITAPTIEIK